MSKRKRSYTPAPPVPPELIERLALVVEVLAGMRTVSQAARVLGVSRNHFQTILHRGVTGLADSITPREGGRPGKPPAMVALEAELAKLKRENARLQERVGSTERLLEAASGLLHGRLRVARRQGRAKRSGGANEDPGEPEPDGGRRRKLEETEEMRRVGLTASVAARVAGVHEATLRRWRTRSRRGEPLVRCRIGCGRAPAPELAQQAGGIVRALNGLVGAESLRRSLAGLSRRQAARVKAQTLTEIERDRRAALTRVTVTVPGVVRGMDAMHLRGADGAFHAIFCADGAVPYRTSVATAEHYDAKLVARALAADIEENGVPIVYRLDRAKAHDTPAAHAILRANEVLVLHGPPHCPRFYGQLERQNREHRAWAQTLLGLPREKAGPCLERMLIGVNAIWRRRILGWKTAQEAWNERPVLDVDRRALREEVQERTSRIARELECRGKPADLAERLAIEQALQARGYLRQQVGGWC